jgi:disulfide bond formation protein DsbB
MATTAMSRSGEAVVPAASEFDRLAGICGVLVGVASFVYAIAFVVLKNDGLSAAMLGVSGLLTTVLFVALYERLRPVDAPLALLGLLLGLAGALGALIHGGYDLANALHPPVTPNTDLPSAVDPRGLLVFGVAGIALLIVATLIGRTDGFPRGLAMLGYVSAVLLIVLYLGRLIILDAKHPLIVVVAILSGFLVNPAWNIWVGLSLLRAREARGCGLLRRADRESP